jgi:hypothetical protein
MKNYFKNRKYFSINEKYFLKMKNTSFIVIFKKNFLFKTNVVTLWTNDGSKNEKKYQIKN